MHWQLQRRDYICDVPIFNAPLLDRIQIFNQIKKLSVGRKFKICMLTKATAATQGQAPHLRQK